MKRSIKFLNLYQHLTNNRNETGAISTNPADTKRIRECYQQLHTHKYHSLDQMDPFLEKYKLLQLTNHETDNVNSSIFKMFNLYFKNYQKNRKVQIV